MNNNYPDHIQEVVRISIAKSLLLHEFKKLFIKLTSEEIQKLNESINGWWDNPGDYNLAEIRDFWNGVDGFMNGFKLKNITPLLTAENITWREEDVPILSLIFTADFEEIKLNGKSSSEIKNYLEKNPSEAEKLRIKNEESFSRGEKRDIDKIIVLEDSEGKLFVHDGNGRNLRALLNNKDMLPAYIGKKTDDKPETNFWIPTRLLIDLTELKQKNYLGEQEFVKAIVTLLKSSQSAQYEFENRVSLGKNLKAKIMQEVKQ
jgi:hypothetical protein